MFNENAYIDLREFLVQHRNRWQDYSARDSFVSEIEKYFKPFAKELDNNRYADSEERVKEYWHTRINFVKDIVTEMKVETENMSVEIDAINATREITRSSSEILPSLTGILDFFENIYQPETNKQPEMEKDRKKIMQCVKLKWNGNQKQLAELFLTLEKLNWIEPILDGDRTSVCRNICSLFDLPGEVASFIQIMKKDTNAATKEVTYPGVFSKKYKPRFAKVLPKK